MVSLAEVLTSWGAVYAALFLPALLMLANFVFGNCFVSEALGRAQHAPHAIHTRSRVIGRAHVALVTLSFAWQYYVAMFVARTQTGPASDARACNPAFFVWDVVDALPWLTNLNASLLVQCHATDVVYLASFLIFAYLYVSCVFSVPQVYQGSTAPGRGETPHTSRCRKCDADIYQMDHHCYLICNCVGASNRLRFLLCLLAGVFNLSYLLYMYGVWVALHGDAATNVGALLVLLFDAFLASLLCFQALLWRKGWTTKDFLLVRANKGESLWRSVMRLVF